MNRRFLLHCALLAVAFLSVHCGGGGCENPNPDYDPQDPSSGACLDGPLLFGVAVSNHAENAADSQADCPPEATPTEVEGQVDCGAVPIGFMCPEGSALTVIGEEATGVANNSSSRRGDCPPGTSRAEYGGQTICITDNSGTFVGEGGEQSSLEEEESDAFLTFTTIYELDLVSQCVDCHAPGAAGFVDGVEATQNWSDIETAYASL